jgi:nucleotide-binding universal stress UspA family protein
MTNENLARMLQPILESLSTQEKQLDNQIGMLQNKLREVREKQQAIRKLLDLPDHPPAVRPGNPRVHTLDSTDRRTEYRIAILESLVELGGKEATEQVLRRVKEKLEKMGVLRPEDYRDVPSGSEERWRNTARWERFSLVLMGLLRHDSPRGIWEITDAGREWLRRQKTGA